MGLFDKKECAICGGKVKGLFPASFGDKYVCDDCLGEVHIHDDVRSKMTVEDFLKYREFRDENQKLKAAFRATNTYNFGLFSDPVRKCNYGARTCADTSDSSDPLP